MGTGSSGPHLAGAMDKDPVCSQRLREQENKRHVHKEIRMIGRTKPKYSVTEMIFMLSNLIFSQCTKMPRNNAKSQRS